MTFKALYNDFSKGQVSPFISGKIDTELYAKSAEQIINFLVRTDGSLQKRNGTEWFFDMLNDSQTCALCFLTVEGQNVLVIFGKSHALFFSMQDSSILPFPSSDKYDLATPWTTDDIVSTLNVSSFDGTLYVTGKDVTPRRIWKTADADGVVGGWNIEALSITESSIAKPRFNFFSGMRWYILGFSSNPTRIVASRTPTGGSTRFTDFTFQDLYLVTITYKTIAKYSTDPHAANPTITYTSNTSDETREVYTNQETGKSAVSTLEETTKDTNGNITAWTITQTYYEKTVESSVLANHAIDINEMDSSTGSKIVWAFASKRILVGYEKAIMMDNGDVPTPANFDLNPTIFEGCGSVLPVGIGSYVIYTGINNMSIKAMKFDYQNDAYVSTNISSNINDTVYAEGGVTALASQLSPFPIVWALLASGKLMACTFDIDAGVIAWTLHDFTDPVKAICVFRQSSGNEFLVLSVLRNNKLSFETMSCDVPETITDSVFLDCSSKVSAPVANNQIALPDRLANHNLSLVIDNSYAGPAIVVSSMIKLARTVNSYVRYGISYTAKVLLHPCEYLPNIGSMLFKKRCLKNVIIRFYKSLGGEIVATDTPGTHKTIAFTRYGIVSYGEPTALFSGNHQTDFKTEVTSDVTLMVTSDIPLPMNILAIVVETEYKEA